MAPIMKTPEAESAEPPGDAAAVAEAGLLRVRIDALFSDFDGPTAPGAAVLVMKGDAVIFSRKAMASPTSTPGGR